MLVDSSYLSNPFIEKKNCVKVRVVHSLDLLFICLYIDIPNQFNSIRQKMVDLEERKSMENCVKSSLLWQNICL